MLHVRLLDLRKIFFNFEVLGFELSMVEYLIANSNSSWYLKPIAMDSKVLKTSNAFIFK